jgi:hypothetical protein
MAKDKYGKEIPDEAWEHDFGTRTRHQLMADYKPGFFERLEALVDSRKPKNSIESIMSKLDNEKLRLGGGVTEEEVDRVDKLLAPLEHELTGVRFVTQDAEQWLLAREGQTIEEHGYTRLTLAPDEMRKVVGDEVSEVRIVLPKGTQALVIGNDVLVKRNQKFEIRQDAKWFRLTLVAI